MKRLDQDLRLVAAKEVNVSLVGESGAGKEIAARRIHELSPRRSQPFVAINCAALPESLFESELFGHERGAFTGATAKATGKLEAAHGGTLFLDEIGEMPLAMQAKLLRFLEHRRFMRVGGTRKIEVDARVISATLRPLEQEVRGGRFRADLFYRIEGVALVVPPLRDRGDDLGALIEAFRQELATKHRCPPVRFGRTALSALRRYQWPGNVRELRNLIERLTVLRAGKTIALEQLPAPFRERPSTAALRASIEVRLDAPLRDSVEQIVSGALALAGGNRSRAARTLGVSVRTLQRRAR